MLFTEFLSCVAEQRKVFNPPELNWSQTLPLLHHMNISEDGDDGLIRTFLLGCQVGKSIAPDELIFRTI